MLCCGQERTTAFCSECGKQLLLTLPLEILVQDLRFASTQGARGGVTLPWSVIQLEFWANALEELIAKTKEQP